MEKDTLMDVDAASRIQSAAAREPESDSAQSGFDSRAQSTADQSEYHEHDDAGEDAEDDNEDDAEDDV
jgi:hypothetical protein